MIIRSQQYASVPFNDTIQSTVWSAAILVLTAFGIGIIFYRRPNNFENGLAMLILIFAGFALDLIFPCQRRKLFGIWPADAHGRLPHPAHPPAAFSQPHTSPAAAAFRSDRRRTKGNHSPRIVKGDPSANAGATARMPKTLARASRPGGRDRPQ